MEENDGAPQSLGAGAGGGPTAAEVFPARTPAGSALSDQRRLQRLCEWRTLAWKAKTLAREHRPHGGAAGDGVEAEREVAAHRRWLASQTAQAEADFWGHLPGFQAPQAAPFVPFVDSKWFTAAECLECPLQEASRHWFRWLSQSRAVEQAVARAAGRGCPWRETLTRISRVQVRFESADFAWKIHLTLHRDHVAPHGAGENERPRAGMTSSAGKTSSADRTASAGEKSAAAPTDWLAGWAAAEIGETYLRPLMARTSPEAGPERLRHELLLEIWAVVLSLHPDRLTAPAFCGLPSTVAAAVRGLHTDAGDGIDRLKPETRRFLLSPAAPDPQAVLLDAERLGFLQGHIRALPPQQRRAVELAAEGMSRREIAQELGCLEETVKTHLERARTRLRAHLPDGHDLEA